MRQPVHHHSRSQLQLLDKLKAREAPHHRQDGRPVDALRDPFVAFLPVGQGQTERRDLPPEALVIKQREPLLQFVPVTKRLHPLMLPEVTELMQAGAVR